MTKWCHSTKSDRSSARHFSVSICMRIFSDIHNTLRSRASRVYALYTVDKETILPSALHVICTVLVLYAGGQDT